MAFGCSSFTWDTEDGKHLLGRTYDEFGDLAGNRITVVPRGIRMKTQVSENSNFAVNVKYAHMGMAVIGLHTPVMVDGINEKGLMGALLNYPGYAVYNTRKGSRHINVHPGFLIGFLLGQCASLEEVIGSLTYVNLTDEKIFGEDMSVHYIFSDSTGHAAVIEPDRDEIKIHCDSLGVMTNSPDYLWHKTNLRNYLSVTNLHTPPRKIIGTEFTCFGHGTGGGFGLPGDYSSPSRFVRTAMMKNFGVKGKDEIDGITRMFHNFASVNIPEGIMKASPDQCEYAQTLCTCAMCSESLTYYFNTARNFRISALCLENELKGCEMKYYALCEKQDILFLNSTKKL
ncbi:MAG: linear amide C-N hydrolase [Lachnospiraceae bacterium]|nr:linear amide C-N hydrolase [Lachnospiraceae bacterium]MDE6817298.1 linear amide C-N hydrolase [Lachnospiraceae bacterium]